MAKLLKKGKKKHRGYRGGPPSATYPKAKLIDEIECVVEGLDTNYQLWLLRPEPTSDGWLAFKLTALQRRRKANYWFGWSITTNRSNGARDLVKTMKTHDPELFQAVVQSLKSYVREHQQED